MKQKLALMCTLLHRPRILFLDEPTNGVDPVSRRDFWAILYQLLKDGITIFMTTAYLDEAERCNRVGLMHKGKLIRCDTPDAIEAGDRTASLEGVFIQTIRAVEAAGMNGERLGGGDRRPGEDASARSWPWTTSRCRCARARSSASWGRTGRGNPPPSACCAAC